MKSELNQIQWLRGIAAILVVLTHFLGKCYSVSLVDFSFPKGAIGVDIFFVISGFIMMFVSEKKHQTPIGFFSNRFFRVYPIHLFFLMPLFFVYLINPNLINSSVSKTYVWQSFFLIPEMRNDAEYINPVIWTLCYEMLFYLIFSFALFFKNIRYTFISTISVIVLLAVSGCLYNGGNSFISAVTDSISIEFCFGMIIYHFYKKGFLKISPFFLLFLTVSAYCLLANLSLPRFIKDGVPSSLLFILFINLPNIKIGFLNFLGNTSYEIYICHVLVLSSVVMILRHFGFTSLVLYFSLTVISILCVSYVIRVTVSNNIFYLRMWWAKIISSTPSFFQK